MPQISQVAATYAGQLFWLLLTFGAIYLVVGRGMVPKIQGAVDARDQRIAGDLMAARSANDAADAAEEEYRRRSNTLRDEARALTQVTVAHAAAEAQARVAAIGRDLGDRQLEAERSIEERRSSALKDVEAVAADAARSIVEKLSSITVTAPEAQRAVQAVLRG